MEGKHKTRVGQVVSNRMNKTVVVEVTRRVLHPKYKKYIKSRERYKAHDAANECNPGDQVLLEETRPLWRDKRWRVKQVTERAAVV